MQSMTGFGSGEGTSGPVTVTVELRSVNHRFLDVSLKLPGNVAAMEMDIRQFLKDNLSRGRVTVITQMTLDKEAVGGGFDVDRVSAGLDLLEGVAAMVEKRTGEPQTLSLDQVLALPDLFRAEEPEISRDDVHAALMDALAQAHTGLMTMKANEGQALVDEMRDRLKTLSTELAKVVVLAPGAAAELKAKLEERLNKILTDGVDPQRLAQEVALLADKANINEECERLAIHIDHFHASLDEGGQVAKRLNFLLQEMHREVNTMGSKTSLMDITQAVIAMKDEVESMREQILNLE